MRGLTRLLLLLLLLGGVLIQSQSHLHHHLIIEERLSIALSHLTEATDSANSWQVLVFEAGSCLRCLQIILPLCWIIVSFHYFSLDELLEHLPLRFGLVSVWQSLDHFEPL